jgi:hypothetical protein
VYALLTALGAVLTVVALAVALLGGEPPIVTGSMVASLVATALGFVGTSKALPAMTGLWEATDEDEVLLATFLDRFARWGTFSAAWHIVAFAAALTSVAALAA